MNSYALTVDAEEDLDAIWDYIARDSVETADRWINKLFDTFENLAQNPRIGHKREDLTALPVLFWPLGAYLIIYRLLSEQVQILAITRGSRDIPMFLRRRESSVQRF